MLKFKVCTFKHDAALFKFIKRRHNIDIIQDYEEIWLIKFIKSNFLVKC